MKNKLLFAIAFIILVLQSFIPATTVADPIVIANVNRLQDRITKNQVREIFLLKQRHWADGTRILLCRLPMTNFIHRRFVREVLGLTPEKYETEWLRLMKLPTNSNFKEVSTEEKMISCVSAQQGTMGYVDADHLLISSTGENAFKTLMIVDP